jgi:hypothetical protein
VQHQRIEETRGDSHEIYFASRHPVIADVLARERL